MTETHFGKLTRKLLALAFLLACFAFVSSHGNTMARNMKYVCCSQLVDLCNWCVDQCGQESPPTPCWCPACDMPCNPDC
jgi:hypothetical protein